MPGKTPGHQAEKPEPDAEQRHFAVVERAAGEVGQQPEAHAHEHQRGHGAHRQVEVRRDPQGVVHHVVELPAGIHDAPGTAEDEAHQRQHLRSDRRVFPGQGGPPAHQALAAAAAPSVFEAEGDGEGGDQAGNGDRQGQRRDDALHHRGNAGVGVLMVRAHRQRKHEQQQKRQPRQRIRHQLATRLPRQQGIDGDIARHQPVVNDGVARPPEQRASEQGVDGVHQPHRPRIEQEHRLGARAQRRQQPHQQRGRAHIGHQRGVLAGVGALPAAAHLQHDNQRQNARHHHQGDAQVEPGTALERRIHGVEHARRVVEHGVSRHQRAQQHQPVSEPGQRHIGLELQLARRQIHQPTGNGEKGEHIGVEHAMHRQALVIRLEEGLKVGIEIDTGVIRALQHADGDAHHQRQKAGDPEGQQHFLFAGDFAGGGCRQAARGVGAENCAHDCFAPVMTILPIMA